METPAPVVAIVDDSESVLKSVGRLLRSAGYKSICFESAEDFLLSESYREAACLIADFYLPGMNGKAMHWRLRDLNVSLPVVFLTGMNNSETRGLAGGEGVFGLFFKPFNETELLAAVGRAVDHVQSQATAS